LSFSDAAAASSKALHRTIDAVKWDMHVCEMRSCALPKLARGSTRTRMHWPTYAGSLAPRRFTPTHTWPTDKSKQIAQPQCNATQCIRHGAAVVTLDEAARMGTAANRLSLRVPEAHLRSLHLQHACSIERAFVVALVIDHNDSCHYDAVGPYSGVLNGTLGLVTLQSVYRRCRAARVHRPWQRVSVCRSRR
jgi:hypothetical protein